MIETRTAFSVLVSSPKDQAPLCLKAAACQGITIRLFHILNSSLQWMKIGFRHWAETNNKGSIK